MRDYNKPIRISEIKYFNMSTIVWQIKCKIYSLIEITKKQNNVTCRRYRLSNKNLNTDNGCRFSS